MAITSILVKVTKKVSANSNAVVTLNKKDDPVEMANNMGKRKKNMFRLSIGYTLFGIDG